MKKIIASLITIALLLSMTACSGLRKPEIVVSNLEEVNRVIDSFDGSMAPQEVLEELRVVDLTGKKINYSGMESETVTDEENSTSITYYSKDGERVYAVYEGYGEECVDFYTETVSGYKATVKYIYPGTDEASADITFEKDGFTYNSNYEILNSDSYYGAESIYVSVIRETETFNEYLSYFVSFSQGEYSCVLELARYIDSNGDYRDFAYEAHDEVLIGKYDDKNELCDVPVEKLENSEILMGKHEVYLGENDEVYIKTKLVRIFPEDTGVDEFVKEFRFTKGRDIDDEVDIAYKDVVLKFSKDCVADGFDSVIDLVTYEYNDYVYDKVKFNEAGEICEVSNGTLSYY